MSTSFASLVTDVMSLTNRPDLTAETNLAVKAATLKAHHTDDYIFDLGEYSIAFDTAAYYQTLDYKTVIPLWRKPRYFRKYDNTAGAPGDFLSYIQPEQVVDNFGYNREDIYYIAGANLQLRSSTLLQYALLSCYLNPTVTDSGYSSWIANDYPFAIIYEATAIIFKTIGNDEQVPMYREMVKDELAKLTIHAITGLGM